MEGEPKIVRRFVNKTDPPQNIYIQIPSSKEVIALYRDDFVFLEEIDIQALYRDKHYTIYFKEGWLVEEEEYDENIYAGNKNAMTDADIDALLAKHVNSVIKEIKEVTSINTLKRIRNRAFDLNKSVKTIKEITDKIENLQRDRETQINQLLPNIE